MPSLNGEAILKKSENGKWWPKFFVGRHSRKLQVWWPLDGALLAYFAHICCWKTLIVFGLSIRQTAAVVERNLWNAWKSLIKNISVTEIVWKGKMNLNLVFRSQLRSRPTKNARTITWVGAIVILTTPSQELGGSCCAGILIVTFPQQNRCQEKKVDI